METTTSLDSNANHSVTVSSNNNAAESTADRDQRPRARCGFGFKPPQAKHGRPGPVSRVTGPTMPLPPSGGDGVVAEDGEKLPVNGETGHVANGVGDRHSSAPPRGPPAAGSKKRPKDAADVRRQTTAGRTNKQSALRRPGQRAGASGSSQQPPQQRVRRVTPSTSDHSTQMLNGAHGKVSAPANGHRRSSTDKSVKLLVNYRSTNDRHAPLHSAYGNRDFFGPSSASSTSNATSTRGTADASAGCPLAAPRTGKDDGKQPAHSSPSRLVCFHPQRTSVLPLLHLQLTAAHI